MHDRRSSMLGLLLVAILVIVLPLTVLVAPQQLQTQQHAASTIPQPVGQSGNVLPLTVLVAPQQLQTQQHAASTIPQPVGQSGNWNMIFDDEFNESILDTSKWNTCFPNFKITSDSCNHNNGELQLYQPGQVVVNNGIVTLRADKKTVTAGGQTFTYLSGMLSTGPGLDGSPAKFTFTYGYMEIRFKVPKGRGLWPGFWTLPADGGWPPEIDGFEILGDDPHTIVMTYHWNNPGPGQDGTAWTGPDFSADWHVLGVDWEPNAITWYVDGVARQSFTNAQAIWNKPMYLLANLAIGGWHGYPDTTTVFPADYQIDYIRVWQKCTTNCTSPSPTPVPTNTPVLNKSGRRDSFYNNPLSAWVRQLW